MPTKYDTNPLDPEFPAKVMAESEGQATQTLGYNGAETRQFPPLAATEEQTRRFAGPDAASYATPYNGQYVPATYQPAAFATADESRKRKVDKVGLPENILVALPYLPFQIGLVAGLIELLVVPKHETKVRFHAAQGLAAHVGILIITTMLGIIGNFANMARVGGGIFTAVTTIMLIVFAIKAWKGRPVHIEAIDDLTNWLDDKIKLK
ncbi:MAG TPA: hypothetical protein VHQ01_10675 [Pyrinomonadaceae bacterium]|nr:hypothetical protein [Pyrinomonadaceae bacterium]